MFLPQHRNQRTNVSINRMCEQKKLPSDRLDTAEIDSEEVKRAPTEDVSNWTLLGPDFVPTKMDVIVGTGRDPKNHEGNALFRELLKLYITRYSSVGSKLEKTLIISEIVASVRDRSPTHDGFVKKVQGQWYAVDDHQSREKVSQGLRNILHDQYRSSAKSKKRKRGQLCAEMQKNVDEMMKTKRSFLSQRMTELSSALVEKGKNASEEDVEDLFTQANIAILEGLKKSEKAEKVAITNVGHGPNVMGSQQQSPDSTAGHAFVANNQAPIPFAVNNNSNDNGDINQKIGVSTILHNAKIFDEIETKNGSFSLPNDFVWTGSNWKVDDDSEDDDVKNKASV